MSKRYPRAKWVLPNVVDPSTSVCYTVPVPNDRFHIAAFLGALQDLGSATQWADDEGHTAKDVAQVWRDIIDELEKELCSGCKHTNPEFHPALEAGETVTFSVTVEAGEFQVLPILLKANQSITISGMVGQWRDSTYHPDMECSSNWETPLGIVINASSGIPAEEFITDIMPDIAHMKLIMRVNNCGILTYHDLDDPITFTVPGSVSGDGVFVEFLANMPLDEDGEVASGFLGYGMVCFKVIVSDPDLCAQVFIDFTEGSESLFTLVEGDIVETSPIDEGEALKAEAVSGSSIQAQILIPVDDCTVRDIAFTYYRDESVSSFGSTLQWELLDGDDEIIENGTEPMPIVNEAQPMTVDLGSVPGVFTVRLRWHTALIGVGPALYIDNVFVN